MFFGPIGALIGAGIGALIGYVTKEFGTEKVAQFMDTVGEETVKVFKAFYWTIDNFIVKPAIAIFNAATSAYTWIKENVDLKQIGDTFSEYWENFKTTIAELPGKILESVTTFATGIKDTIWGFIQKSINWYVDTVNSTFESAGTLLSEEKDSISTVITDKINAINELLKAVKEKVMGFWMGFQLQSKIILLLAELTSISLVKKTIQK